MRLVAEHVKGHVMVAQAVVVVQIHVMDVIHALVLVQEAVKETVVHHVAVVQAHVQALAVLDVQEHVTDAQQDAMDAHHVVAVVQVVVQDV